MCSKNIIDSIAISFSHITASDFHIPQVNDAFFKKGANLEEINYFCLLYFVEMGDGGRNTFDSLIRSGYVPADSPRDLLHVLINLDNYYTISGAGNYEKVAKAYVAFASVIGQHKNKHYSRQQLKTMGQRIVESESGIFFEGNYIALYPVLKENQKTLVTIPENFKLFKGEK